MINGVLIFIVVMLLLQIHSIQRVFACNIREITRFISQGRKRFLSNGSRSGGCLSIVNALDIQFDRKNRFRQKSRTSSGKPIQSIPESPTVVQMTAIRTGEGLYHRSKYYPDAGEGSELRSKGSPASGEGFYRCSKASPEAGQGLYRRSIVSPRGRQGFERQWKELSGVFLLFTPLYLFINHSFI